MSNRDDRLIQQTQQALDMCVDQLDSTIAARLRTARLHAVEAASKKNERLVWARPVGGLVTATLVVAVAASLWMANPSMPKHAIEDMELLASAESPEFYQDLEFYLWLEERSRAG